MNYDAAEIRSCTEKKVLICVLYFKTRCHSILFCFFYSFLKYVDQMLSQGGDGLFNEVLNGLLCSRHKAPYPPAPTEFSYTINDDKSQMYGNNSKNNGRAYYNDENGLSPEISSKSDDHEPLISTSEYNGVGISKSSM